MSNFIRDTLFKIDAFASLYSSTGKFFFSLLAIFLSKRPLEDLNEL